MEWEVEEPLPYLGLEFEVWLKNDSVRRVRRMMGHLVFTDCTHPMQNVICRPENVAGWRAANASPPPAA